MRVSRPALAGAVCTLGSLALWQISYGFLIGANVHIGELNELKQFGRVGDTVGLLGDAPICNDGTSELDWLTGIGERHPFLNYNLYRLKNGRLEQIGQSWTKHAQGAAQEDACGLGCNPHPTADRLGVGCSDTYSAAFSNNTLSFFGPRSEINPWTGSFSYPGSHISQGPHSHGAIDHKMHVRDADLDPSQNSGATYFYECYVLAWDDADHMDSIAREPVTVSGAPGGTWTFNLGGNNTMIGPAIQSWPGATVISVPANPTNDGRVFLGTKITTNPNGSTHYEYAIYNHDMDRAIRSFAVPFASGSTVANIGFHAVASHEESYSNAAWATSTALNILAWATQTHATNPLANSIRYGTMYNFWFDCNAAPAAANATLGVFKPGTPTQFTAATQGPAVVPHPGDITGDSHVNVNDLLAVINTWGPCPPPAPGNCLSDISPAPAGDGVINVNDLLAVINAWG